MTHILVMSTFLILIDCQQFSRNETKEVRKFRKILNDSIFDGGTSRNKAYLKNRLLENLNNFFPSTNTEEQLEILSPPKMGSSDDRQIFMNAVTEPTDSENFPTLLPNEPVNNPIQELELATAPSVKIRNEGRMSAESTLDTIRDWRKRLYRAFKNRDKISRIIKKSPNDIVEMNDESPFVLDKNRQTILRRKAQNWDSKEIQTYGRDTDGKLIPLFGIESGYLKPPTPNSQKPIEPYPAREIRLTYRTSSGQPVVYIPGPRAQPSSIPMPVASYLVTTSPPTFPPPQQSIQLHLLPSVTIAPPPMQGEAQQAQLIFSPSQGQSAGNNFLGHTINVQSMTTYPPAPSAPVFTNNPAPKDYDGRDLGDCMGQCSDAPTDEKCNSLRLRSIIMNNIVNGDAEASKRAVQSAAEAETGLFIDAICGTGFFSYIAHTDEFCLASSGGINCYVFSPVCSDLDQSMKSRNKKTFLSRN